MPRGPRRETQANAAGLTARELELLRSAGQRTTQRRDRRAARDLGRRPSTTTSHRSFANSEPARAAKPPRRPHVSGSQIGPEQREQPGGRRPWRERCLARVWGPSRSAQLRFSQTDRRPQGRRAWLLSERCGGELRAERVTPPGVEEPRSGRLAAADADLRSLSYEHLLGDATRPASRGSRDRQRSDASPKAANDDKDAPSAQRSEGSDDSAVPVE